MGIRLINIGFGNIVSANRIVSIVSPESAPIKRIIQETRDGEHSSTQRTADGRARSSLRTVTTSSCQPFNPKR